MIWHSKFGTCCFRPILSHFEPREIQKLAGDFLWISGGAKIDRGSVLGGHWYQEIDLAGFGSFGELYWFHVMFDMARCHFFTPQTSCSWARLALFGFSLQV